MYGYEIVKAIQFQTKDSFSFGEGCIYPLLHYLEQTRSVSSRRKEVAGGSPALRHPAPLRPKRLRGHHLHNEQEASGGQHVLVVVHDRVGADRRTVPAEQSAGAGCAP